MPKFLKIQKLDIRQFSVSGFAAALKPNDFGGTNYKIWHAKMVLWLTAINCYHVAQGKHEQFTSEEEQKFLADGNLFWDAVISALHSKYENNYIPCTTGKDLWDALDAKFDVSNADSELYIMEQLFDYKMFNNRSMVEQAHEIQALAKELE